MNDCSGGETKATVLEAFIDLTRETCGCGRLTIMSALQAMCDPGEEAESPAYEKLSRSSDPSQTLLAFTEKRAPVFTMEKSSTRGHYRRSVLPFPWSIDMYAPVIHV